METYKQLYDKCKKLAQEHRKLLDRIADIELNKFGFEFAVTDSDKIIDSLNYGTDDYPFEDYLKEMKHYSNSLKKSGNVKSGGVFYNN